MENVYRLVGIFCFVVWSYYVIQRSSRRTSELSPLKEKAAVQESKTNNIGLAPIIEPKKREYATKDEIICYLNTAKGEIGVREVGGNNRGKRIKEYLATTNLSEGHAWCAAFVCWTLEQCNIKHPRSAWSPTVAQYNIIYKEGTYDYSDFPSEAFDNIYVFGLYKANLKRIGHTGFIIDVKKGAVVTIEGNTNGEGNRDGDGVESLIRPKQTINCVSNYVFN